MGSDSCLCAAQEKGVLLPFVWAAFPRVGMNPHAKKKEPA
jgi:hypothetical protein